ncbi:MAG: hypothetical protein U0Q16_17205 [Bryobacteraceae bacterium]
MPVWTAFACSCIKDPTTCEFLKTAQLVFVGTVVKGTEKPGGGFHFGDQPAHVQVGTVLKGMDPATREILVDTGVGSSCYYPMQEGERWLVVGRLEEPNLVVSHMCLGSKKIEADDTLSERLVQSFSNGPNLVTGSVSRRVPGQEDDVPAAGIEVKLSGHSEAAVRTSATGLFEFRGVESGEYRLDVKAAGETATARVNRDSEAPIPAIQVEPRGCSQVSVLLFPDQSITGRVTTLTGQPVKDVMVAAYAVRQLPGPLYSREFATDENGVYVIPRLANGTYIVGINGHADSDSDKFAATFYPAVHSAEQASRVVLDGKGAAGIDIRLDPARRLVETYIRVVFADGKPAVGARVEVNRDDKRTLLVGSNNITSDEGDVIERLWEGDEYIVTARWVDPATAGSKVRSIATGRSRVIVHERATAEIRLGRVEPEPAPRR